MPKLQSPPTPPIHEKYTKKLYGTFGELGEYDTGVRYIQTAISVDELDDLTLVEDIPGSEDWGVRQLFQRGVSIERVEDELIPYFEDPDQRKYFNPLTIALMPMDGNEMASNIKEIERETKEGNLEYACFEVDNYYNLFKCKQFSAYSRIEWNPHSSKMVAIDGQHRLSALKRMKSRYYADKDDWALEQVNFKNWTIPIVVVVIKPKPERGKSQFKVLESFRNIFVTINKTAKRPTRCQLILLDDFNITSICCQEYLDYCHKKKKSRIPLLFFDWRALEEGNEVENPASFLRVEEFDDFHIHYLLGENDESPSLKDRKLSSKQRDALNVSELKVPLDYSIHGWREKIRELYRSIWIPAIERVLSEFIPTKDYIENLSSLDVACKTTDQKLALHLLKYGTIGGKHPRSVEEGIKLEKRNLEQECRSFKEGLQLIKQLIGLRGVFSAFGLLRIHYNNANNKIFSPEDYSIWFVGKLNEAYTNNYLSVSQKFLRHIAIDHNEKVCNYRHREQERALGAYLALILSTYEYHSQKNVEDSKWAEPIRQYIDDIYDTIMKGYKKEVRPIIERNDPNIGREDLKKAVNKMAKQRSNKHMIELKRALDIDDLFSV